MTFHGIYFVGGASGAGKSRATQHLARLHSVALIELDDLQRSIMPAIPDADQRAAVTRAMADLLIESFSLSRAGDACVRNDPAIDMPATANAEPLINVLRDISFIGAVRSCCVVW